MLLQVTGVAFLERTNRLLSCSKDSYLKVWELPTQHCSQTVAGYKWARLAHRLAYARMFAPHSLFYIL